MTDEFKDSEALPDSIRQQAQAACDALQALQEEASRLAGGKPGAEIPKDAELTWSRGVSPESLAGQAMDAARAAASDEIVFRPGHIYCFRCRSAECEHAQPATAGDVFSGYDNSGKPKWLEFFNCLLAWNDDRVDRVFGDRPQLLARMVGRKRLISEQFVSCGRNSMTYRIIGQVIAGYFHVRQERCAVTVQVVENRQRELHVQLIAPDLVREALADAPDNRHSAFYRIYDGLRELRHRISDVTAAWRNASGGAERQKQLDRIFTHLRHLMNSIERKGRQSQRRTRHAQQRSEQKRPVHKAYDDLAAAAVTDLYLDRGRDSIIVVGRRGRAHVFSAEGKHVTSLAMPADKLERRVRRKRYTPLPAEDARSFLATVNEK